MYDIRQYFRDHHIRCWTEGKNVSRGWLGVRCIFCDDQSNHLGFNPMKGIFTCWLCGKKGSFTYFISVHQRISREDAKAVSKRYLRGSLGIAQASPDEAAKIRNILPRGASKEFSQYYLDYLEKRRFDPEFLISKYDLYAMYAGPLKFRIIIPVKQDGIIMSWIGLDTTGKKKIKYKMCPNEESNENIHNLIYNLDNCQSRKLAIMEGVTDVWRFGDDFAGLMGKKITPRQMKLILNHPCEEVYMVLDSDAFKEAEKYSYLIRPFKKLWLVKINRGDPDNFTTDEVRQLKRDILM